MGGKIASLARVWNLFLLLANWLLALKKKIFCRTRTTYSCLDQLSTDEAALSSGAPHNNHIKRTCQLHDTKMTLHGLQRKGLMYADQAQS